MPDQKLVGQNYTPPDLVAKVTGPREVRRGLPRRRHAVRQAARSARCRTRACARIDTRAALAMPGVKAILTADDLPDLRGAERALTNEPLYQGEPILAVAAVDELTAAEAIERIDARSRAAAVRRRSGREPAAGRRQRPPRRQRLVSGAAGRRQAPAAPPPRPKLQTLKWTDADFAAARRRRAADGQGAGRVVVRRSRRRLQGRRASSSTKPSSCSPPAISRWKRAARWPTGRTASCILHGSTQSVARTVDPLASWLGIDAVEHRADQRVLRRRLRQQGRRRGLDGDSGAAVEEGRRAGDDAHQPRGGALHRPRAHRHGRPRQGRLPQGRTHHRARSLHRRGQRSVRADGRLSVGRQRRVAHLAAARRCAGAASP